MQRLGQALGGDFFLVEQALREVGEFGAVTGHGLLGMHALGHVAQDGGEQLLAAHRDLGDRRLQLQQLAVGVQAAHLAGGHGSGGGTGVAKPVHVATVVLAVATGQQDVQVLAEHGVGWATKDAFGGWVEQADTALDVDADDRIAGRIDHGGEHLAFLAHAPLGGEVVHLGHHAERLSVNAHHLGQAPVAPHLAAVAAPDVAFELPRTATCGHCGAYVIALLCT